jgi:hypothetical protein
VKRVPLSVPFAFICSSRPAAGRFTVVILVTGLSKTITAMSCGSDCRWLYSGLVCIVPCSSFEFESKDGSNVTQMSVWPVDSTNDVQCDAVTSV